MACRKEALEALLCERGLAATVRRPALTGVGDLDARARLFTDGPPARAITELVLDDPAGRNAGLTSMACGMAARATRGENVRIAWVDPLDQWDPDSAHSAGVALAQVLWLRGAPARTGMAALSLWHEALGVLIQSGGMELVVADFSAWPTRELRRIPRSAWFRLLRGLERSPSTALLLLAPEPLSQSCATLVVGLRYGAAIWPRESLQRLRGVQVEGRLLRQRYSDALARRTVQADVALHLPLELRA